MVWSGGHGTVTGMTWWASHGISHWRGMVFQALHSIS